MVLYRSSSTYPITAAWLSRYIATLHAHDIHRGYGSILAHVLFLYIIIVTKANIGIPWNSHISAEFQWIPTHSNGFHLIPLDSIRNSMEWQTKMAEAPAKWILSEFHGIPTFCLESGRFCWNSWGRVKTLLWLWSCRWSC